MDPITLTDDLAALCERLKHSEFVTVDTEFLRESTYYPKLCLIQIASDDEAAAIDPLADGLSLDPFFDLMSNETVLKVLHAARQDLEIFLNLSGSLPKPLFDTQVAAMVCGFGESVGYETLVNTITKKSLDKSHRYTDWSRRPLTDAQLSYAIGDVTHLRDIYRHLSDQLDRTDRRSWVAEEMAILGEKSLYITEPMEAWKRLKVRTSKPRFLGILQHLAAWRELQAQDRDMPRNRVAKDEVLLEIAAHPPSEPGDLDKIRGLPKGFSRSKNGASLLTAVTAGLETPDGDLPKIARAKPRPATPPMADLLKVLLKVKSKTADVAPRLIASAGDLEAWAAEPHTEAPFLQGWRGIIFGQDAKRLLSGDLALTSANGEIEIVEIED